MNGFDKGRGPVVLHVGQGGHSKGDLACEAICVLRKNGSVGWHIQHFLE